MMAMCCAGCGVYECPVSSEEIQSNNLCNFLVISWIGVRTRRQSSRESKNTDLSIRSSTAPSSTRC